MFEPRQVLEIAEAISRSFPQQDPYSGAVRYALALVMANACRMDGAFSAALANYDLAKSILSSDKKLSADREIVFAQTKAILEGKAELFRLAWDYEKARECYCRVLDLNRNAGYMADEVLNICNIAAIEVDMADHGNHKAVKRAECLISEAEKLMNTRNSRTSPDDVGTILGIKGRLQSARGDYLGAAAFFNSATKIFRASGNYWRVSRASRFEASALIEAGEFDAAQSAFEVFYESAKQRCTPHDKWRTTIAELIRLSNYGADDWSRIIESKMIFSRFIRDAEIDNVKCMVALSSGLCRISKIDEAVSFAQEALLLAESIKIQKSEIAARLQLVQTLRLKGEIRTAEEHLQLAFKELETLSPPDQELILFARTERLLEARNAFSVSAVHRWALEARQACDCSSRMVRSLVSFHESLATAYFNAGRFTMAIEALEAASRRLPISGHQNEDSVWRFEQLETISKSLELLGAPKATVLLTLDTGNEVILAEIRLSDARIRVTTQKVPWNDKLRDLLAEDMKNNDKGYDQKKLLLNACGIIDSVQKHENLLNVLQGLSGPDSEIIYVVVNGIWNNFPFECFIKHPVCRITSLAMLECLLNRVIARGADLPVSSVVLCSSASSLPLSVSDWSTVVEWAGRENAWPDAADSGVTISDIYEKMCMSKLVHIATHCKFERFSQQTGLELELKTGKELISMFQLVENVRFRFPGVVYLNNCESGMVLDTRARRFGIPYAFLDAGASSCCACMRKIPDLIAAIVCDKFYKHLGRNGRLNPAEAIYNSINDMSKMTGKEIEDWAYARFDSLIPNGYSLVRNAVDEVTRYWKDDSRHALGGWMGYRCFGLGFVPFENLLGKK